MGCISMAQRKAREPEITSRVRGLRRVCSALLMMTGAVLLRLDLGASAKHGPYSGKGLCRLRR